MPPHRRRLGPAGNIFIADGYCNNRVVKYDRNGRFLAQNGSEKVGKGENEYNLPHGLQVDHQGNVYVADRGNARYVVLDNNLKWKTSYNQYGSAWSDCISEGPHQYLFVSNSNPNGNAPGSWKIGGQIYKMELDGTVSASPVTAGRRRASRWFMMDCRNPNQIIVGRLNLAQKFARLEGEQYSALPPFTAAAAIAMPAAAQITHSPLSR